MQQPIVDAPCDEEMDGEFVVLGPPALTLIHFSPFRKRPSSLGAAFSIGLRTVPVATGSTGGFYG